MIPRLEIVTLALDALPFLSIQLSNFNRIDTSLVNWHWRIVHGSAANRGSTRWCRPQKPGLSKDGTTEILATWKNHPRISIYERPLWEGGKDQMFQEALNHITDHCILLQSDADEFFEHDQLETLVGFFNAYQEIVCAKFFCQFFIGPNIIITSENGYGNRPSEWVRCWRYSGQKLISHEPPVIAGLIEPCATREQTRDAGLVFQHWAYALEKSLIFKEQFYQYKNATLHWKTLQQNKAWPITDLSKFLPWVGPGVTADLLHKS